MAVIKKLFFITSISVFAIGSMVNSSLAQVMKCYVKNDVGEMSIGEKFIYDRKRNQDVYNNKPSIIDYNNNTIVNPDTGIGTPFNIINDNFFMIEGGPRFVTNDNKSILLEVQFQTSVGNELIFSRILFCKEN